MLIMKYGEKIKYLSLINKRMDKNKIYKKFKDVYTDKQIEDMLNGKEIADVWWKKEKRVKNTWNKNKKGYSNIKVLGSKKGWKMKSYKFTEELDRALIEKSYEMGSPIKKMFEGVGLSTNTYFAIKRRWVISPRSLYKVKKLVPDFDFSKIENE